MAWFSEDETKHFFVGIVMSAGAAFVRAFFGRDKRWKRFFMRVIVGAVLGALAALITMSTNWPEWIDRCLFFACGWGTKEVAEKLSNIGVKSIPKVGDEEENDKEDE